MTLLILQSAYRCTYIYMWSRTSFIWHPPSRQELWRRAVSTSEKHRKTVRDFQNLHCSGIFWRSYV